MHEAYRGEMMLLSWSETSTRGRTVTFLLPEETETHPFRDYALKSGKRAGQRFAAILVELTDGEEAERHEQSPVAQAALMCKDPVFWRFASERGFDRVTNEQEAATWLRRFLTVNSRSEIPKVPHAMERFRRLHAEYSAHRAVVEDPL